MVDARLATMPDVIMPSIARYESPRRVQPSLKNRGNKMYSWTFIHGESAILYTNYKMVYNLSLYSQPIRPCLVIEHESRDSFRLYPRNLLHSVPIDFLNKKWINFAYIMNFAVIFRLNINDVIF